MNKTDMITAVAGKACMTKKNAEKAINAVFEVISDSLAQGAKVQIIGFGTFEARDRKGREGRNPRTGEPIEIVDSKVPAFKAGVILKKRINQ